MPAYKHNSPKKKSNWVSRLKSRVQFVLKGKKETAKKKRYLKHYKAAGKKAMTYAEWSKKGESHAYYKLPRLRKKSVEARMRESGMTANDRRKFEKKR